MQISPIQQTQYQTTNPSFQNLRGYKFVEKIRIANFALKMKRQGYQLLRNPKELSPSIVRVLKYTKIHASKSLDISEHYERITKDFSHPQDTIRESLYINSFTTLVDTTKKLIERNCKLKEYYRFKGETGNDIVDYRRKGNYPDSNRASTVDDLNRKIYNKKVLDSTLIFRPHYPDAWKLLPKIESKNVKESLSEIEEEKFNLDLTNNINNSFWGNLFNNLFK